MNSLTTPDFWAEYNALPEDIRDRADEAYALWIGNPRHPSLQFMRKGRWWSVRITDDYRALGRMDGDTMIWFFIGNHAQYMRILKG